MNRSPTKSRKNRLPPWLQPKGALSSVRVAVNWYTPEEWALMKASATDPDLFEPTFKEWEAMAEEALAEVRAQGLDVRKCMINANEFLAWCLAHGKENNAASRAEYSSRPEGKHFQS